MIELIGGGNGMEEAAMDVSWSGMEELARATPPQRASTRLIRERSAGCLGGWRPRREVAGRQRRAAAAAAAKG